MELWKLITLGIGALLVAAILIESWLKRDHPRSTLAGTLGKNSLDETSSKPRLGMEEIDMNIVREAERMNTNLERNNSTIRK